MLRGQRDEHASRAPYPSTPPAPIGAQLPSSRLPLRTRAVTKNPAPSRPQWISHVVGRVTSAAKTASGVRLLRESSTNSLARSYRSVNLLTLTRQASTHSLLAQNPSMPSLAASMDKPLPPRPTEDSSNMQMPISAAGPSNLQTPPSNGNFLIDASDDPVQFSSPSGTKRDWPALTPTPAPIVIQTPPEPTPIFERGDDSPKSKAPVTPASIVAAAAELTKVITGSPEQKSSPVFYRSPPSESAYESANEGSLQSHCHSVSRRKSHKYSTPDGTKSATALPMRASSFRGRIPSDSLIPQPAGSTRKSMTLADFTGDAAVSPTLLDSRQHSPSPQSFSRPRPASVSVKIPASSIDGVQTASRLPITESQKPTIVDVKPRNSQGSAKSAQQPPTFGSRRLDSRTADILDNGIKRRQLQRSRGNVSDGRRTLYRAATDASDAPTVDTPPPSVGRTSSAWDSTDSDGFTVTKSDEDLTFAPSASENGSEITTPVDQPTRYSKRFERNTGVSNTPSRSGFDAALGDESSSLHAHPPPTSPITAPLPTIPSEAALPVHRPDDEEKITQALSYLEGKGSPPKHDVDDRTLRKMFGHMAKTFEAKNATMSTSGFLEDAANAKRFLAMAEKDECEPEEQQPEKVRSSPGPLAHKEAQPAYPFVLEPAVSKWSDTTPSEREMKEDSVNITKAPNMYYSQQPATEPTPPPAQEAHARSHESIGYPSRVAQRSEMLTQTQNVVADVPDIARRKSSPTLGPKSGSVRRACESVRSVPAYARSTQAAEARMNSRLPTPTTTSMRNQRGRQSTATTPLRHESEGHPKV